MNFFKQVCFFKKMLTCYWFSSIGCPLCKYHIPGVNISGGKVSVADVNGAGVLGCFGGVLYTSIHVIILIRRNLCFYNQTNEFNVKMILVLRFSPWLLYLNRVESGSFWYLLLVGKINLFAELLVSSLVNLEGDIWYFKNLLLSFIHSHTNF